MYLPVGPAQKIAGLGNLFVQGHRHECLAQGMVTRIQFVLIEDKLNLDVNMVAELERVFGEVCKVWHNFKLSGQDTLYQFEITVDGCLDDVFKIAAVLGSTAQTIKEAVEAATRKTLEN